MNIKKEEQEQIAIMDWCRWQERHHPELKMIFHIVNEGQRSPRFGVILQKMGMKKGIPDICLPVPNKQFHGLYIELKADKTKRISKEQKEWLEKLSIHGYKAVRANGAEEAIGVIKEYLNIKERW
ncbi:VRR-NUC domain-containing protein [[Clostridium] sordellii]|uniref:VRR-NUC domain-containing protein n=1 Tax=Paraclostridium sordellii TaxID=1505 RepID=UPI0005E0D1A2|nr:VRR-NUC domain-containing protein [Paeniclostridium sordellii]CEQ26693.1 VRR-NUC domain-containing protein [[Clostridium] sordellii] [Paeniclostridium sordellii]